VAIMAAVMRRGSLRSSEFQGAAGAFISTLDAPWKASSGVRSATAPSIVHGRDSANSSCTRVRNQEKHRAARAASRGSRLRPPFDYRVFVGSDERSKMVSHEEGRPRLTAVSRQASVSRQ
jgi:hypothetical protein